jgi:hypothetical protein
MSNESIKPGVGLDVTTLEPAARSDADLVREKKEASQYKIPDGRKRRRVGRTEPLALRTFPEIKRLIHAMAEAQNKDYVEIVEEAVKLLDAQLKGRRG